MNMIMKCNCGYNSECWEAWSIWEESRSIIFNDEPWASFRENIAFNERARNQSWSRNWTWSTSQRDSSTGRIEF